MSRARNESLSKLADAAFEQAADQVIQRAKQTGTPVIVWEDGRMRAMPSEEMGRRNSPKPVKKNDTTH